MSYVNFVQVQLDQPAAATDTTLYIRGAVAPYNLPPEDGGVLVLADSIYKPSVLEVVRYTSRTGLVLNDVQRGVEGTAPRDWAAGSVVFMSLTAGGVDVILQSIDAALQAALTAETSARQQALSAESQARQQADQALLESLQSEAAARQSAITAESQARQQAIEAEAAARQAAVTELAVSARTVDAVFISTATQAEKGKCYVLTASLTLTLPASPAAGDVVRVVNQSGSRAAVVARNGRPIMGLAEDMVIDALNASVELMYADATRGWVLI